MDRAQLEVRFVADLLAHVDRRVEDCSARLALLEDELAKAVRGPDSGPEECVESLHAEAVALQAQIKRLHVATTLVHAYMQMRRKQLAELRAAADGQATTMEVS
jgi:uncharacterized coiled-coil DUF342 family protein